MELYCPTAINGYNDFNENLFQLKEMVGFEKIDFPTTNNKMKQTFYYNYIHVGIMASIFANLLMFLSNIL